MTTRVAAVDLGATSGRVVVGTVGPGRLETEVVARFPNDPVRLPSGLHWDVVGLYRNTLDGLAAAVRGTDGDLAGIAVDSWAVDYGLLRGGRLLGQPHHYRDEARAAGVGTVHRAIDPARLYERNGLQHLPFTTVYQLAADPLVPLADSLLLVPDLLAHWMTGQVGTERTNASTTGLLDVRTGTWDDDLVAAVGLPRGLLGPLVDPGDVLGPLLPEVARQVGRPGLPMTAVGSHDTASAVVGVPMDPTRAAYISCGTWGLVGLELEHPVLTPGSRAENFTNERGVDGRIRFLRNVTGLWLLSQSLQQWRREGEPLDQDALLAAAADLPGAALFDVQDPRFAPPGDLPARIAAWFTEHDQPAPPTRAHLVRSILESLATEFARTVDRAQELAGVRVDTVHVVGGGAVNPVLCQALADRSGRTVVAGPVEATAIGNVLVQARTAGALSGDLAVLRDLVHRTQVLRTYAPRAGAPTTSTTGRGTTAW